MKPPTVKRPRAISPLKGLNYIYIKCKLLMMSLSCEILKGKGECVKIFFAKNYLWF